MVRFISLLRTRLLVQPQRQGKICHRAPELGKRLRTPENHKCLQFFYGIFHLLLCSFDFMLLIYSRKQKTFPVIRSAALCARLFPFTVKSGRKV